MWTTNPCSCREKVDDDGIAGLIAATAMPPVTARYQQHPAALLYYQVMLLLPEGRTVNSLNLMTLECSQPVFITACCDRHCGDFAGMPLNVGETTRDTQLRWALYCRATAACNSQRPKIMRLSPAPYSRTGSNGLACQAVSGRATR